MVVSRKHDAGLARASRELVSRDLVVTPRELVPRGLGDSPGELVPRGPGMTRVERGTFGAAGRRAAAERTAGGAR